MLLDSGHEFMKISLEAGAVTALSSVSLNAASNAKAMRFAFKHRGVDATTVLYESPAEMDETIETDHTAHGTFWNEDADEIVKLHPDKYEYVNAPYYWKEIDY